MESPNYLPNTEPETHQSPKTLEPCLPLDIIDDGEDEIQIADIPDSSLSDEFDFDEENDDFQACDGKMTQDNKEEILKLADTQDPIKANRTMMIQKLTSMGSMNNLKDPIAPKLNEHPICVKESQESASSQLTVASSNKENISENITVSNSSETIEKVEGKLSPKSPTEEIKAEKNSCVQDIMKCQSKIQKLNKPVLSVQSTGLPIVEGYLKKKTDHFLHPWHTRYLALKDNKLLYYKNGAKDKLLGCIDFFLIQVKIEVDHKDPKRFMIMPIGSDKIFTFKAEKEEDVQKWISALTLHTKVEDLSNTVLGIAAVKNFWKHDRISEQKFLAESKTGDLILFRGGSLTARVQRSVTRSEYDHVGIILKYSDGDIVLLEASANQGVGLCRWTTFKRNDWHILYEKVVYRKLTVERNRDMIEKAEKFVRSVVGKKYKLTAKKLFQKKSTSIGVETPNSDRTFFCSELVAACYKRMELLPKEVSSAQYLPVSFSADKKLPLLKGARLGDELLIDFNM